MSICHEVMGLDATILVPDYLILVILILAILMCMQWYVTVVSICISKYYYQDDFFLGDGFGHHLLYNVRNVCP